MTYYLVKMTKWLGYFLAFLVIIAATLVSVGRLLTPYLNEHKPDFELWAGQFLNSPVTIKKVHISWNGYTPELVLDKVTVLDKSTHKPTFVIRHIEINAKILTSLVKLEPVLSLIKITGMDITVRAKKTGELNIVGFGDVAIADNLLGGDHAANEVVAWIFSQPALALSDIHITYIAKNGFKKSISLYDLTLQNVNQNHLLSGKGVLNQEVPTNVELVLDWRGDSFNVNNVSAKLYLYLEGISLPQWFKDQTWKALKIKEGLGSTKIWLDWDKGALQKVQTQLQLYQLSIYSETTKQTQTVSRLSGHFGWKREGESQVIAGDDILMDLPHHLWPATSFSVRFQMNDKKIASLEARTGYLDLADLAAMALFSGMLPSEVTTQLNTLKPKGEVTKLHAEWNGEQGLFAVASKKLQIAYPSLWVDPLFLGELSGAIQIRKNQDSSWSLDTQNLALANNDLRAHVITKVELAVKSSPYVDMVSQLEIMNAKHLVRYIPIKPLSPEFSHWLTQALGAGKFTSGNIVLQGRLQDFPFKSGNGKFNLSANADDVDFSYALRWPAVKHLKGTLQCTGDTISVDIKSGVLLDIPIKDIHATVANLTSKDARVLTLNGRIDSNLAQLMQFVRQSPLHDKLSKTSDDLQIAGPMQLNLDINLPLKKPENLALKGDLTISQASVSLPAWNLALGNMAGKVSFTEKSLETNRVTGLLWGEPFVLQIHTQASKTKDPVVKINMQSRLTEAVLHSWIHEEPFASMIHGSTDYQITLNAALNPLAPDMQLKIDSNLNGLMLDLPMGIGKEATEAVPLILTANLKKDKPLEIKSIYGDKLKTAITIQHTDAGMAFYSGEILLGTKGEVSFQKQPGLLISGQFEEIDWNKWKQYATNFSIKESKETSKVLAFFRAVDIRAKKVTGFFQALTNARLQLAKTQDAYRLQIQSDEMDGVIAVPTKPDDDVITVDFDHLYLAPVTVQSDLLDPTLLPAISFVGNDVRYQNKSLGRLSFDISPVKDGLSIDFFRLSSDLFKLDASGEWLMKDKKSQTALKGKLNITDVADFVSHWGSPSTNPVGSSGKVIFDLAWPGAPFNPVPASMSGNIDISLSAGRIVNLDESTNAKMGFGRLLNLLSLESISRALTLNFSDLTEKGYSFDAMNGYFVLKDGNAFIDEVRMDGSIARIEASGRVGLAAKDFDIDLSVTPFVTGSIPVVTALAVNPVIGVAAWAIEKVLGRAVSSATAHEYRITGTWDKPVWVEKE